MPTGGTKMKKPSRKTLVKKLDQAVSLYIRNRDKACVVCGSSERLNNGHIFSRTAYSTRWDITEDGNCHAQCWPCNYRHEHDSYPFNNWYIMKFGKDKWDELHRRYSTPQKYKDFELIELIEHIKGLD
jgi:hypothetical protein